MHAIDHIYESNTHRARAHAHAKTYSWWGQFYSQEGSLRQQSKYRVRSGSGVVVAAVQLKEKGM